MTDAIQDHAKIREAAYLIWLGEGQPEGRDQEHWLQATDALTAAQPKAKPARKAAAKPRTTKAKAAPKAAATTKPKAAPKAAAAPEEKQKATVAPRKPRTRKPAKPATT